MALMFVHMPFSTSFKQEVIPQTEIGLKSLPLKQHAGRIGPWRDDELLIDQEHSIRELYTQTPVIPYKPWPTLEGARTFLSN